MFSVPLLLLGHVLVASNLDSLVDAAWLSSETQLRRVLQSRRDSTQCPWKGDSSTGTWITSPPTTWTAGFFPGCLRQIGVASDDPLWDMEAQRWEAALLPMMRVRTTHDIGFVFLPAFLRGMEVEPGRRYDTVLVRAGKSLATRFNAKVGATKSWNSTSFQFPVIIDNLMNLPLLVAAGRLSGDSNLVEMAVAHGRTTIREHQRADGSVFHVVDFDTATGRPLLRTTTQGNDSLSSWARGQAWSVHGFATLYAITGKREFLEASLRTADYFWARTEASGVPHWDFKPGLRDTLPDASAGAVAASGMYLLSDLDTARSSEWRTRADRLLEALLDSAFFDWDDRLEALLAHGREAKTSGKDIPLIYGDFYLLEAMARHRGIAASAFLRPGRSTPPVRITPKREARWVRMAAEGELYLFTNHEMERVDIEGLDGRRVGSYRLSSPGWNRVHMDPSERGGVVVMRRGSASALVVLPR